MKRPIGKIRSLRWFDPHFSDLAGVLVGEKPVLYTDFKENDWPYIEQLCRACGLKYRLPEYPGEFSGTHFHHDGKKKMLLLGREDVFLDEAEASWRGFNGPISIRWGTLLGYPECCVRAYAGWRLRWMNISSLRYGGQGPDIIRFIHSRTKGPGPFSFLLNNVWNYFSRLDYGTGQEKDRQRYLAIHGINSKLDMAALNVITWHPCSYLCEKSIEKGKKIYAFMEYHAPEIALRLKRYLANPLLYFDKYEFVALDGHVTAAGVEFDRVLPPYSLLNPGQLDRIKQGHSLVVTNHGVTIQPNARRIIRRTQPPIVLDFR